MRFTVPQFIEQEGKIIGPLTLRQFAFVGVAAAICFILYFTIGKISFFLFLLLSTAIIGTGASLAFLKVNNQSLPKILINFFRFTIGSKIYIWQKKETPIKISKEMEFKKRGEKEEFVLKTTDQSQLKKIKAVIETKSK